ncbi:RidA family protein [Sulfurospirillum sp. 1612]|uniref:RidA family protein n=1 Tax=Sulfurospirillum sp. 1612 TaxID=3094835 RepID=UPI002F928A78
MNQPIPQGLYRPAVRYHDVIYTSGMTPRVQGVLQYSGKITAAYPLEHYQEAVKQATTNSLTAALALVQEDEKITLILQLNVYINAAEDFLEHSKIADFASALLAEKLGEASIGSRAAIGVATLPSNAPVEIALVAGVSKI